MASLKRYRQATDSSAASRCRDLPPRFKRQKSIPSSDSNASASDSPKQSQPRKPKKLSPEDFMCSGRSATGTSSSSDLNPETVKDHANSKDKKILKKGSINRPLLTVEPNLAKKTTQPIVLSPMENSLFNLNRSDDEGISSVDNINPFSWQNEQQVVWPHYQPGYGRTGVSQADTMPYNGQWTSISNRPIQQATESSQASNTFQSASYPIPSPYPERTAQTPKDYSETDRRIIEMFKELERVADEKEKEEENGTDRKPHVSHHLRMLMCAIDKYTEGIEDETDLNGRDDEAISDERSSPSPASEMAKTTVPSTGSHTSPQFTSAGSVFSTPGAQTTTPVYVQGLDSVYQQVPNSVHYLNQAKDSELHVSSKVNQMQPWDLWSSPSFNMFEVYSNFSKGHNSSETADSTFALFDQLGMEKCYNYSPRAEEYLTRTPLYRR